MPASLSGQSDTAEEGLEQWHRTDHTALTNEDGEWRWDKIPPHFDSATLIVKHPDFATTRVGVKNSGTEIEPFKQLNHPTVLTQGAQVKGLVTGEEGQPIENAIVYLAQERHLSTCPQTRTDSKGEFLFRKCPSGKTHLVVEAEGYAMVLKSLILEDNEIDIPIGLTKGKSLRGKVVGVDGKPLENIKMSACADDSPYTFLWSTQTDEEGRFSWNSVPEFPVLYRASSGEYTFDGKITLLPGEPKNVVTVKPVTVVRGNVIDVETGEAIPKFEIYRGRYYDLDRGWDGFSWTSGRFVDGFNGKFELEMRDPDETCRIKIVTTDYLPAISDTFSTDGSKVQFDFELIRGDRVRGKVLSPEGLPLADTPVVLAASGDFVSIHDGELLGIDLQTAMTNSQGQFEFSPQDAPFDLFVDHDTGFGRVPNSDRVAAPVIQLEPWGRIAGAATYKGEALTNEKVTYMEFGEETGVAEISCLRDATTTATGAFVLEKIPPGKGYVSLSIKKLESVPVEDRNISESVEVTLGETLTVDLLSPRPRTRPGLVGGFFETISDLMKVFSETRNASPEKTQTGSPGTTNSAPITLSEYFALTMPSAEQVQFCKAIEAGNLKETIALLDSDSDLVHARYDSGETPLHIAAKHGHQKIVELLLDRGAEVNAKDGEGKTAWFRASLNHGWVARILIEHGAEWTDMGIHSEMGPTPVRVER